MTRLSTVGRVLVIGMLCEAQFKNWTGKPVEAIQFVLLAILAVLLERE